jgi:hypothetical protein
MWRLSVMRAHISSKRALLCDADHFGSVAMEIRNGERDM